MTQLQEHICRQLSDTCFRQWVITGIKYRQAKSQVIWLETCYQLHGRKYQHCSIAFVTESGANREYEAADILGQATNCCRVIHPIKVSFDS